MKDKLYSRKTIKIPNFRKYNSIKAMLLLFFSFVICIIIVFCYMAYPIFKASCETVASSKGNEIVNNEVNNVMKNYTYNSLINIEKDTNGKISLIEANTKYVNEIVSQITSNIQKEFDKLPRVTVYINMGSVSGISILKNIKPNFNHHKIYLDVKTNVGILTPFGTFKRDINAEVLLTEAIIVGEVPESYYNFKGNEEENEIYNFIK